MRRVIPADLAVIFGAILIARAREYVGARVRVEFARGCWVWQRAGDGRYGHAEFCGQRFKAHILAYLAFVGPIPRNRVLDHHHCDRRDCASPRHLKPVTQSQNMKRCFAIGRGRSPFLKDQDHV